MVRGTATALGIAVVGTLLLVTPASGEQVWLPLQGGAEGAPPRVDVADSDGRIVVDVDVYGAYAEAVTAEGRELTVLSIPQCGAMGRPGEPSLPFRSVMVPVPNGPAVTGVRTAGATVVVLEEAVVYPSQPPQLDCTTFDEPFVLDDKAYGCDAWYPAEPVHLADDVVVRGQRYLLLEVSPLQFNPARREVVGRPHLRIEIDLAGPPDEAAEERKLRRSKPFFDTRADGAGRGTELLTTPTGVEYLIIADDDLVDAIQPLAEWKRLKGFTAEVVPMSTVGSTSAHIESFMHQRYDADPDLTYLLLVGDHPQVPAKNVGYHVTDLYYSCLDGSDYLPDIVIGRLSVASASDCANVVDKILAYERTPDQATWRGDLLMAALLQDYNDNNCRADRWFFETGTHAMHFVRDEVGMGIYTAATSDSMSCNPYYFRSDSYPHRFPGYAGQPVPDEDASLLTSSSAATQDVTDAINAGVTIVQHRDHGGVTGWGDPSWGISNISSLANGIRTPVVFSINCLTGTFDNGSDCFAEAFMKKYPGGAVGVIAATESSYSGYNDLMVHGAYDCMWDHYDTDDGGNLYPHSFRPAQAFNYGKYYMYHWEGAGSTTQLEFEIFHWHGDPEMLVNTAVPAAPTVVASCPIPVGSTTLEVTADAEGAMVAVTEDGMLIGRAVVSGGMASVVFDVPVDEVTTLDVVLTGHNVVPWEHGCEMIAPTGPWLVHRGHQVVDAGGNNDGIVNPGENVILAVTVENVGADPATGIAATLSTGSTDCTVTDPSGVFPDIDAGAQAQSMPDHFAFTAAASAPHGQPIPFTLDWTADGDHSGSTSFAVPVCALLEISAVEAVDLTDSSAHISWTTNVPATSVVTYGVTTPTIVVEDPGLTTGHSVLLTGLDRCMPHVFEVTSASPDCYTVTDSAGGAYYSFTTTGGLSINLDSSDTPVSIPDNNPTGASSVVSAVTPHDVIDVNVLVNITHTWVGDLELYLIGPDGSQVALTRNNGGLGDNFESTLFDDDADVSITDGSPPYTGAFRPEEPLTAFDSLPAAGDWTLHVIDEAGQDTGTIDSWQLQLKVNEPCDPPEPLFADSFESGDTAAWASANP